MSEHGIGEYHDDCRVWTAPGINVTGLHGPPLPDYALLSLRALFAVGLPGHDLPLTPHPSVFGPGQSIHARALFSALIALDW